MNSDGEHRFCVLDLIRRSRSGENLELLRVQRHETEIQAGERSGKAEEQADADGLQGHGEDGGLRVHFHEMNALDAVVSSVLEES